MILKKISMLSFILITLSGCAGKSLLEEDPRCPFVEQGGCQSIKSINNMIDKKAFTQNGVFVRQPMTFYEPVTCKRKVRAYIPGYTDKFGKLHKPKEYIKTVSCNIR